MKTTGSPAIAVAVAEARDKFEWEYVPPPPPPPGKIWIKAPVDSKGTRVCPDLHLTPDQVEALMEALNQGLAAYLNYVEDHAPQR